MIDNTTRPKDCQNTLGRVRRQERFWGSADDIGNDWVICDFGI